MPDRARGKQTEGVATTVNSSERLKMRVRKVRTFADLLYSELVDEMIDSHDSSISYDVFYM